MRIACLRIPELPWVAEIRAEPELAGIPLVVTAGRQTGAEVLAASPEARRLGIRPGCSLAHARALCGALRVRRASPARMESARQALQDVALSFSPRAELPPPGPDAPPLEAVACLDAEGVGTLFGSERRFASALLARAERLGLPGRVGIAGSRRVARIAAGIPEPGAAESGFRVVPPGGEAEFLAPLPLSALEPPPALADALARLGLRRIGDLAALPPAAVGQRLGVPGAELQRLARGEIREPPLPRCEAGELEEALDLEQPVERLESLLFALRGALGRLLLRLTARGLAAGGLELELALGGRRRDVRRAGLAAPSSDLRVLLRLIRTALESRPPEDAVEGLRVRALPAPPRHDQLDLWRPAGPAPAALDALLAELASLCGADRVGAPAPDPGWRPDGIALLPFRPPRPGDPPAEVLAGESSPPLALRALRPPLPARVRCRAGRPTFLESALARGAVVRCAGPWRTTGRWWSREERFALDHYELEIEDGTLLRLRYDHLARSWAVDGLYD